MGAALGCCVIEPLDSLLKSSHYFMAYENPDNKRRQLDVRDSSEDKPSVETEESNPSLLSQKLQLMLENEN